MNGTCRAAETDPVARELLQSVVDTARAIFGAAASSIFLLDREADELVFQAVSGEGEDFLVGMRFPAGRGIAGWVAGSGEPMVVDDLSQSAGFARDLAEKTAYVPNALMAAPLLGSGGVLGVLEVLDPAPQARASLGELDLLALFARQAATALAAVLERRAADAGQAAAARVLQDLDDAGRAAGLRALEAVRDLLAAH
ncbi:GAF domain-containing protein [Kitasatospora sp. DSM 101779]|uniref:GAF domain-containing protein n=1 Tax=Kitasatospora sp. DSM 101779 TaxID=2853165 RepID=UPI0021D892DE|nr:GAF domain-containing protein [Kitasatospora sp. DSM 101779]MCU7821199.1 GAF domain-containing protein [Kitasatospora sp. DSM 101779]